MPILWPPPSPSPTAAHPRPRTAAAPAVDAYAIRHGTPAGTGTRGRGPATRCSDIPAEPSVPPSSGGGRRARRGSGSCTSGPGLPRQLIGLHTGTHHIRDIQCRLAPPGKVIVADVQLEMLLHPMSANHLANPKRNMDRTPKRSPPAPARSPTSTRQPSTTRLKPHFSYPVSLTQPILAL